MEESSGLNFVMTPKWEEGCLDQGAGSGVGEGILKVELSKFTEWSDLEYEKKREVKDDSMTLVWSTG